MKCIVMISALLLLAGAAAADNWYGSNSGYGYDIGPGGRDSIGPGGGQSIGPGGGQSIGRYGGRAIGLDRSYNSGSWGRSRAEEQAMQHGYGGCTPNFATGGCL